MENETRKHIQRVGELINNVIHKLLDRATNHDKSKLEEPETSIFNKYTPLLKQYPFGSEEYNRTLTEMQVAIDHHYKNNRHHPEHFKTTDISQDPICEMNLIDIIEMTCDWLAASERQFNGNINQSITQCVDKFRINKQLEMLIRNTVKILQVNEDRSNLCNCSKCLTAKYGHPKLWQNNI